MVPSVSVDIKYQISDVSNILDISDIPIRYLSKLIPSPSAKSLVNRSGQIQLIIWKMEMSQKI